MERHITEKFVLIQNCFTMIPEPFSYLVLVSERSPVTISKTVLRSTPFCRTRQIALPKQLHTTPSALNKTVKYHTDNPMFRNSPPSLPDSLSKPPMAISTIHSDSGVAGKACILRGCRQSCGSRDMTRTVLSLRPMARNLERCSPAGTVPRAMHCTSEDISFRSVYSLSWPD